MAKYTKERVSEKPRKPRPDFPLFPHATRRWAKKIRGKLHYFGPWEDPEGSLQRYLDQRDYLVAGRKPPVKGVGVTVRDLANTFLTHKRNRVETGELTERTFIDYHETCGRVVEHFGRMAHISDLGPADFEQLRASLAKDRKLVALGNEIQRVRSLFKFAFDQELVERPVRFGQSFCRPSRKAVSREKQQKGKRMFEVAELRAVIQTAGTQVRAMVYLAINCGFGNSDCANLTLDAVDLDGAMVEFPRPKTGVERRCPLWPETVAAIRDWLRERPTPKLPEDANLVFVTAKMKQSWRGKGCANPIASEMSKVLDQAGIRREGLNFYALRHTFATIGGDTGDQVATSYIMGHAPKSDDMAAVYRKKVFDHRLHKVVDHVRQWLFGEPNPEVTIT